MKAGSKGLWARCGIATGLFLLGACSDVEPLRGRISSELSPECALEIALAVDFWAQRIGIDSPIDLRVSDSSEGPQYREIVFVPYTLENNKLGRTEYEYNIGGETTRATVAMRDSTCNMRGVAHELGHAFQLKHRNELRALMHEKDELGGFRLTSAEISKAKTAIKGD